MSDGKLNVFVRIEEMNFTALLVDRRHQRSGKSRKEIVVESKKTTISFRDSDL